MGIEAIKRPGRPYPNKAKLATTPAAIAGHRVYPGSDSGSRLWESPA
jgi:hypothetical protein